MRLRRMMIIGAQCAAHLLLHHTWHSNLYWLQQLNTMHMRAEQALIMAGSDKLKLIPCLPLRLTLTLNILLIGDNQMWKQQWTSVTWKLGTLPISRLLRESNINWPSNVEDFWPNYANVLFKWTTWLICLSISRWHVQQLCSVNRSVCSSAWGCGFHSVEYEV